MGRLTSSFLSAALLLGAGFGAGWWLRGQQVPPPTPVAQAPAAPVGAPVLSAEPESELEPPARQPESPPPAPVAQASADNQAPAVEPATGDVVQQLHELLAARQYGQAMQLYRDVERRDYERALELKQVMLSYLRDYQRLNDRSALTGLIDAYLSYDYDDLDVLLVLAEYHQSSGYFAEAARTFQLAFTYAYDRDQQQQVGHAFADFVRGVDRQLAREKDWRQLMAFYESLQLLDLIQPTHELRLAELYLSQGQTATGRAMLARLRSEPDIGRRAEELLADTGTRSTARRPEPDTTSLELGAIGGHYHLPLRLNQAPAVRLVMDTGATTTTLSRASFDLVSRYGGFTQVGPQIFNTANGPARGMVYRAARVQLADQLLADVDIAVLDLDMPDGVDGLLGMNVLSNFRFQLDQDEGMLHLQRR